MMCLLVSTSMVSTASAADVSGSLTIPTKLLVAPSTGCADRACYWNEQNGVYPSRPYRLSPARHITVVLTSQRQQTTESQTVLLHGGGFLPSTVVVANGATLNISNADGFHRAPIVTGLQGFNTTTLRSGDSVTAKLLATGHWVLGDKLIPHARGNLHVISNLAAVGEVNDSGTFRITDVEPGAYTLVVYYQQHILASQQIFVPSKGQLKVDPIALSEPKPN
jgi:hypothetical protein